MVLQRRRPSGFIEPCQPSKVARPPSGPLWVHELKHDGYRLMVRRDGARVRCFTRNGHDWADRFPAIVEAAARLQAPSFLIDGEAVIARDDGTPDFHARRSKRRGHEAVLFAFDLIEQYRKDLRDLPLIERKRRLKKLIGKTKTWVRDPVRRMPTSAAIWLRCERPRFQPAIRPRHGGRASGERRLEHPVA